MQDAIRKHIEGKISRYHIEDPEDKTWTRYDITIKNDEDEVEVKTFSGFQAGSLKEGDEIVCDYIIKQNGNFTNHNIERIVLKKDDIKPKDVLSPELQEKLEAVGDVMNERGKNLSDDETHKDAKEKCDKITENWNNILILDGKKYSVTPL